MVRRSRYAPRAHDDVFGVASFALAIVCVGAVWWTGIGIVHVNNGEPSAMQAFLIGGVGTVAVMTSEGSPRLR